MDLGDLGRDTRDGLHMASLAGAWIAVVAGLGGMRASPSLSFAPRSPEEIERLTFRITYRSRRICVRVTATTATYELLSGPRIGITHYGAPIALDGAPVELPIPSVETAAVPTQPQGREPVRRTVRRQTR